MNDDDPLLNSPLDASFRAAHRVLRGLTPKTLTAPDDADLQDVIEELRDLADRAQETAAGQLGPLIKWSTPPAAGKLWAPVTLQVDLEDYQRDDPPGMSDIDEWSDTSLARAARAYRRECNWDYSPDEAGIWLLSVAPYGMTQAGNRAYWRGTLTAFVILHDRDQDTEYETLAHMWTAPAWRRRGIGSDLVRQARGRFPLRQAEGPVTDEGRLLLERCAPELLGHQTP